MRLREIPPSSLKMSFVKGCEIEEGGEKMAKLIVIVLMLSFIVGNTALLYAGEAGSVQKEIASYRLSIGEKAARGTKNVLFGWTEIPKKVVDITKESKNPIWGILAGTYQGSLKAMARTISGVSDVVTAPITPAKDPLIQSNISVD